MKELYKFSGVGLALLSLSLFISAPVFSQRTLTARSNVIVDSFVHGFYESLPASYSSSTKKYPLLVFLHGQGEIGNGSPSSLPLVLLDGPVKQLNQQVNNNVNANFPDPVVVNGQSFEFIVIAPQLNTWPWNGYEQLAVNDMINYAISHYRVDTSKMYLTGMSMGGGIAWEYPGFSGPLYAKRLAGLLVVAGASSPSSYRAAEIVKEHLPVWATANSVDNTVPTSYTTDYVALLNAAGANPAPLITIFPDVGHGGWLKTYGYVNQPGVVQNGLNVYQWMLQYKRVGDNVIIDNGGTVPGPPVSSAGADQTITLPTSTAALTGSGSETNGTITAYQWTAVSGPNTAAFANAKAAQTTVSGLIQGTYVFQLTVTDNAGKTAGDQLSLTVNAAPPPVSVFTVSAGPDLTISLPTTSIKITGVATVKGETIATCKWRQVSGPSTAVISGSGSITPTMSSLVGGAYIFEVAITSQSGKSSTDQMQLTVNAGTFIAYAGPDVTISLPTSSWKIQGAATVKGQGVTSCRWKEVSGPSTAVISGGGSITPTISSLVAGAYVFEVDLVSTTGSASSDQMTLTVNTAAAAAASIEAASIIPDSVDGRPTLRIYPNPVSLDQQFIVEGQGLTAGTVKFMIYDINGKLVKEMIQKTQSAYFLQTISVTGLVRGTYVLTVITEGKKPRNFKLLIQ